MPRVSGIFSAQRIVDRLRRRLAGGHGPLLGKLGIERVGKAPLERLVGAAASDRHRLVVGVLLHQREVGAVRSGAERRRRRKGEPSGQGRAIPRHLRAVCRRDHLVPDLDHHVGDRLARRGDVVEQRGRERRVPARAVAGHGVRLRGEGDEGARARLDAAETLVERHRRAVHRGRQLLGEGIVAAGIEEDDVGAAAAVELLHDAGQRHQRQVDFRFELDQRVDRHQIVLAVHLQPVAGIEEQRDLGLFGGAAELDQRLHQRAPVEIGAAEHLEAQPLQLLRQVGGVVLRVPQLPDMLVGRISDHQCDAFLRCQRLRKTGAQQHRESQKSKQCQWVSPRPGPYRATP